MATRTSTENIILKTALLGGSVIDWPQLYCSTKEDVEQLLKINEFHLTNPKDHSAIMGLHNEAIGYLQKQLQLELPDSLLKPTSIEDIFMAASDFADSKTQKFACTLLKIMNVIHLLNGRELLYNLSISHRNLFSLVEDKMERELSALMRKGIKYQGGRKQKESLMTRMISKRDTLGIPTHDRLRFQIVTPTKEDIPEIILHLFKTVLPVNYIIPNHSSNNLIDLREYLSLKHYASHTLSRKLKSLNRRLIATLPGAMPDKEHSGRKYELVKFLTAVPVRLDHYMSNSQHPLESLGCIVQVPVEIRILDQETERLNNLGENSYSLYKERQRIGITQRLIRKT